MGKGKGEPTQILLLTVLTKSLNERTSAARAAVINVNVVLNS